MRGYKKPVHLTAFNEASQTLAFLHIEPNPAHRYNARPFCLRKSINYALKTVLSN